MNYPFCYEPDSLSLLAAEGVKTYLLSHAEWLPILQEGKMFGILVVEKDGVLGFLAAYSGQVAILEGDSFFVPPVFDYLQPDGYFKQEEAMISHINHDISMMENGSTPDVSADVSSVIRDLKNQRRQR